MKPKFSNSITFKNLISEGFRNYKRKCAMEKSKETTASLLQSLVELYRCNLGDIIHLILNQSFEAVHLRKCLAILKILDSTKLCSIWIRPLASFSVSDQSSQPCPYMGKTHKIDDSGNKESYKKIDLVPNISYSIFLNQIVNRFVNALIFFYLVSKWFLVLAQPASSGH